MSTAYCASPAAIRAAATAYPGNDPAVPAVPAGLADALRAAHSPALGLDRSVCLRDVVEALRDSMHWSEDNAYADFIAQKFGST